MQKMKKAFTLVELIVVITILAILATVGFVSFSGYLAGTRDTNRKAQLKSMSDALELYTTKKDLPIPDDKVDIKVWTSPERIIAYQWYIWKNVLETIEYTESWLDPKDKTYFSYYLTKNKKYFQLLAFLEEENDDVVALNLNKVQALDYSERKMIVKWKKLWILVWWTWAILNTPIQELITTSLNIETTTGSYIANVGQAQISWTWAQLIALEWLSNLWWNIKKAEWKSCKDIQDKYWKLIDWIYKISPNWEEFEVYCDMTTEWGGWTFFWHYNDNSNWSEFFTWIWKYRSDRVDDWTKYSIWVSQFDHTEMMVTVDTKDVLLAEWNNKILFYKYTLWNSWFNIWPIPCIWLVDNWYSYKTSTSWVYTDWLSNNCNSSYWNTNWTSALLYIRGNTRWHFWWISMWWDNSWWHDWYWYLR